MVLSYLQHLRRIGVKQAVILCYVTLVLDLCELG